LTIVRGGGALKVLQPALVEPRYILPRLVAETPTYAPSRAFIPCAAAISGKAANRIALKPNHWATGGILFSRFVAWLGERGIKRKPVRHPNFFQLRVSKNNFDLLTADTAAATVRDGSVAGVSRRYPQR
jgi:hypothetical protein